MEAESEVEFTETVGVDSKIVTEAVASGEGETVVAGAAGDTLDEVVLRLTD